MPLPTSSASPDWPQFLAFLDDCKDHPEDDTPRLVLADWLQEHDDPRGELLRIQVLRESLPPADPRHPALEVREQELWAEHAAEWLGPLWDMQLYWSVHRGLLHLYVAADFFDRWAAWTASDAFAWVEKLRLGFVTTAEDVVRLAPMPCLAYLGTLDLYGSRGGDRGVAAVAASPHLGRLRALDLSQTGLGPAGAAALAGCRTLSGLKELNLADNMIGDEGVAALATSPLAAQLTRLDLRGNHITHVGAEALAIASPALERLTTLQVGDNPISDWRKDTLRVRFGGRVHL
jgi:uncharacterized protein (TIGR02996 family)